MKKKVTIIPDEEKGCFQVSTFENGKLTDCSEMNTFAMRAYLQSLISDHVPDFKLTFESY